jgi:hypothetical protein
VPEGLADLLENCIHERPEERLADFARVQERLRPLLPGAGRPGGAAEVRDAAALQVGDRVEGNWKGLGRYYPGQITQKKSDNIHVQYDDGDQEWTTLDRVRRPGAAGGTAAVTIRAVPSPDIRVWDRVMGRPDGRTECAGRVCFREGKSIHVLYDGGSDVWTSVDEVRLLSDKGGQGARSPARWNSGDRVLACWGVELVWWYAGTVVQRQGNQLGIAYDDGDRGEVHEDLVTTLNWSVGDRVFARTAQRTGYRSGTISRQKGNDIQVQYDDGQKEWSLVKYVRVSPYFDAVTQQR